MPEVKKESKFAAIIQARMNSSRLPGKVLLKIGDETVLEKQVKRLKASKYLDVISVATTSNPSDDQIVEEAKRLGVNFYRGDENDVLARVVGCANELNCPDVLEVFGDSPLIDPVMIDEFYSKYRKEMEDTIVTNSLTTTYPPGLEITISSLRNLNHLNSIMESRDPLREHVCSNFRRFTERFRIKNYEAPQLLRRPDIFLEIDEKVDFDLISRIFKELAAIEDNVPIGAAEILQWCDRNQALVDSNRSVHRRWMSFRINNSIC